MRLTVGSLFAGIGGIELGLERTGGFRTVWQVEQDDYCRRVLAKHWPHAERFNDVREVGAHNLSPVDLICGGFPCTDISSAGPKTGLAGERSGLWSEYARIIGELRPRYVLVENVADLLSRGMGEVCGALADLGYDAEWSIVSACAVGAPFTRERLFLLAYASAWRRRGRQEHHRSTQEVRAESRMARHGLRNDLPGSRDGRRPSGATPPSTQAWASGEPNARRVVDGVPTRMDRNRVAALGNAVVPQVAEFIGQRILDFDRAATAEAA